MSSDCRLVAAVPVTELRPSDGAAALADARGRSREWVMMMMMMMITFVLSEAGEGSGHRLGYRRTGGHSSRPALGPAQREPKQPKQLLHRPPFHAHTLVTASSAALGVEPYMGNSYSLYSEQSQIQLYFIVFKELSLYLETLGELKVHGCRGRVT